MDGNITCNHVSGNNAIQCKTFNVHLHEMTEKHTRPVIFSNGGVGKAARKTAVEDWRGKNLMKNLSTKSGTN